MPRRPLRQLVRQARQNQQHRRRSHGSVGGELWVTDLLWSEPDDETQNAVLSFDVDRSQLLIEYGFPTFERKDDEETLSLLEQRDHYVRSLAERTLACIRHCLSKDAVDAIRSVVFEGRTDTIDLSTGQRSRPVVVRVEIDRSVFDALELEHVDPLVCLQSLGAEINLGRDQSSFWVI